MTSKFTDNLTNIDQIVNNDNILNNKIYGNKKEPNIKSIEFRKGTSNRNLAKFYNDCDYSGLVVELPPSEKPYNITEKDATFNKIKDMYGLRVEPYTNVIIYNNYTNNDISSQSENDKKSFIDIAHNDILRRDKDIEVCFNSYNPSYIVVRKLNRHSTAVLAKKKLVEPIITEKEKKLHVLQQNIEVGHEFVTMLFVNTIVDNVIECMVTKGQDREDLKTNISNDEANNFKLHYETPLKFSCVNIDMIRSNFIDTLYKNIVEFINVFGKNEAISQYFFNNIDMIIEEKIGNSNFETPWKISIQREVNYKYELDFKNIENIIKSSMENVFTAEVFKECIQNVMKQESKAGLISPDNAIAILKKCSIDIGAKFLTGLYYVFNDVPSIVIDSDVLLTKYHLKGILHPTYEYDSFCFVKDMMARTSGKIDRKEMEKVADKCLVKKNTKEIEGFGDAVDNNWRLVIILAILIYLIYQMKK